MARTIEIGELWLATLAACRRDLGLYFAAAAPFTLLPRVAVDLFGPPLPAEFGQLSGAHIAAYFLFPAIVGGIATLAIARMALRGDTVREALRVAAALLPTLLVAWGLGGGAIGLGILAFIIPGLYVWARLALVPPLVALEARGVRDAIRRSWMLTGDAAWRIASLLVALLGLTLLATIVIGALGAGVGLLIGAVAGPTAGGFAAAVVNAAAATLLAVLNAVLGVELYRRLH